MSEENLGLTLEWVINFENVFSTEELNEKKDMKTHIKDWDKK